MQKLSGGLWKAYVFFWFFFYFVLLYIPLLVAISRPQWHKYGYKIRTLWARLVLAFCFIRVRVLKPPFFDFNKQYIYVANHTSYLDVLVFLAAIKGNYGFLAKKELAKIPLFGIFFRYFDVPVYRDKSEKAITTVKKAIERVRRGDSLVIFPEGGIKGKSPHLNEFKKGAFDIATKLNLPIVPVCMPDNWRILPDKVAAPNQQKERSNTRIIFFQPLQNDRKKTDRLSLEYSVYNLIDQALKRHAYEDK